MSINNIISISGAIGFRILENKDIDKKIFIFYDDHSTNKYCSNNTNNKLFISELFNDILSKTSNISLILEEPFIDKNDKIKVLWEDSEHLLMFRTFYGQIINKCAKNKICNFFPADIRLALFDISPDEIILNISNSNPEFNIIVDDYMKNIYYLFDLFNVNTNLENYSSVILFIKKVFDIYTTSPYYIKLKDIIINFCKKFIIPNKNLTIFELIKKYSKTNNFIYQIGFPFKNSNEDNFFDQLDKITSGIMELYMTILSLHTSKTNIFIYAGYYHSNNLAYIFETYYNFKILHDQGNTINIENSTNIKNSCISVNKIHFDNL